MMMKLPEYDSHYGKSMNPVRLSKWAKATAKDVAKQFGEGGAYAGEFPVLVYSGMSGISTAVALSQHMPKKFAGKFGMMYVRKDEEKSHGGMIEVNNLGSNVRAGKEARLIFCDDFCAQGNTAIRVLNAIQDRYEAQVDPTRVLAAHTENEACKIVDLEVMTGSCTKKVVKEVTEHYESFVLPKKVEREREEAAMIEAARACQEAWDLEEEARRGSTVPSEDDVARINFFDWLAPAGIKRGNVVNPDMV